jgi:SsrA-binding protein
MILITNKKANFDYEILQKFTAGLSLSGQMVKQIRTKKVPITGKFITINKDKLEIIGLGNQQIIENVPLLLNQKEIKKIKGQLSIKGISCVVLNLQTVGRWLKAEIAIAKGKKKFDKREDLKKQDLDREYGRSLKGGTVNRVL